MSMTRKEAIRWLEETKVGGQILGDRQVIDTCDMAIAALREQEERRWIPVTERLPEVGQIVLVHQLFSWEKFEDGAEVTVGRLRPVPFGEKPYWEFQHYRPDFRNRTIMDNDIICPGNEYVTHWMPLPEPPKEAD